VASTSKAGGRKGEDPQTVDFETAIKKLETIVETMEEGDLPLETLLQRYEEGTQLVQACQGKLEEAELKIKKLEKSGSSEAFLSALEDPEQAAED